MSDHVCFDLADGTLVRPTNPFFVLGSGRCGTTLMRRLILERTSVVIPPENYMLAPSSRLIRLARTEWKPVCAFILTNMRKHSSLLESFGIEEHRALTLLASIPAEFRNIANFWHAFHAIYAGVIGKPNHTGWGDKTPANAAALADITAIFPQARFVFMTRDVFDMAYSYGSMSPENGTARYLEGAKRWVDANLQILVFLEQNRSGTVVVRYEDLVRFPNREMKRVFACLDLPTMPQELNAAEVKDIAAQPHLRNALGDVRSDFVGKGRMNLDGGVKAMIAAIAAPMQIRLHYEPTGTGNFPSEVPRTT